MEVQSLPTRSAVLMSKNLLRKPARRMLVAVREAFLSFNRNCHALQNWHRLISEGITPGFVCWREMSRSGGCPKLLVMIPELSALTRPFRLFNVEIDYEMPPSSDFTAPC